MPRCFSHVAAALVIVGTATALAPKAGMNLSLSPCISGDDLQALVVNSSDNTVRSGSGSLCVTYVGPSPQRLQLQPCAAAPSPDQSWIYNADAFTFEATPSDGSGCLAWNTQGAAVSTWTCSDIAWNGIFTANYPSEGVIAANFSSPSEGPFSGLCVAAVPAPGSGCETDVDCNLNGVCSSGNGTCTCFKPWGGEACGQLQFLPIAAPAATNGFPGASPNETTWGGNAIFFDGLWHLFVAEMVNNCTLAQWGSNSRCAHAVSSSPEGPYLKVDVAVGVWCHNPQMTYVKGGGYGGQDLWALWHIGAGNGGSPKNCNASGFPVDAHGDVGSLIGETAPGSSVHVSNSPYGPWTPILTPLPGCNNPSQMQHPNGTWFLVCDSTSLYSGPNVTGPFTSLDYISITRGNSPGIFEDSFLFFDPRGNWHIFFHTYTMSCDTPLCDPTAISGHSFSEDGLTWFSSYEQPYFNTVNITDGSVVQMSTRERPKLLFDPVSGLPTHLSNGICPTPHCPPQAAIQCKVQGISANVGYWDHTLVVPLNYN